ncbi:MAG TPA: hypothetical protein VM915_00050, partial [Verrucomicrobiae bacterium]|nr:hypothetical protein [Verrucomicrobiae bacterium]
LVTPNAETRASLQSYYGNVEYYEHDVQHRLDLLTAKLASDGSPELARELLKPLSVEGKPVLDLMLGVRVLPSGLPEIDCQLLKLIAGLAASPELADELEKQLVQLGAAHPKDLTVRVLAAALAIQRGEQVRIDEALHLLMEAAAAAPLEPLAEGQRANSRQRAAALPQLALWVVADQCLKQPELAERGGLLAERALEAARRQTDANYAVAILLGRAQAALTSKQTDLAQRHMMDALAAGLVRPQTKKATAAGAAENAAPLTLSQFKLGMSIAKLAAEKELAKLATDAARESLRGGLPVPDAAPNVGNTRAIQSAVSYSNREFVNTGETSQISLAVLESLTQLGSVWRSRQLPPGEMYQILKSVVLPPDRTGEVELYAQTITDWTNPQSLARELARWAVQSEQAADLQQHSTPVRNLLPGSTPPARCASCWPWNSGNRPQPHSRSGCSQMRSPNSRRPPS